MRLAVPFSLEGRNQSRRSTYSDYEIERRRYAPSFEHTRVDLGFDASRSSKSPPFDLSFVTSPICEVPVQHTYVPQSAMLPNLVFHLPLRL